MSNQALPKFMFLHEDSEQMRDKRIQTIQEYKEGANGQVERIRQKRIHNTIQTSHQPNSPGIFNIEYSNKYAVLLQATQNQVLIIKQQELQNRLLTGKQETQTTQRTEFSGEIFLSPSEEILAVCSQSLIQLFHMETIPKMTSPPIANQYQSHRFLWVTDSKMLLWSFEGQAFLLQIDEKTLQQVALDKIQNIQYCTGASIVGNSLLIFQKLQVFIFELGKTVPIKRIDMSWEDHSWLYYDYSYIVEIFRVNVHTSPLDLNTRMHVPLGKEDILGIVLIYYDQDGEDQHQRCLTFFRGNLLEGGKDMRGQQNFYVAQNKPQYYMDQDKKLSFGIKVSYVGCFICIMLERSYIVYIVDPFETFQKINIYSPNGKLELKDPQSKFFRGMAIMKNILPYEKTLPEKIEKTLLQPIVRDFNGEFMMLYFSDQETNLTIPFPASVIALTQDNLYRRYAVSSLGGIDKDKDEEIIQEMKLIKESPYLIKPSKKISVDARCTSVKDKEKIVAKKEQKPPNIFRDQGLEQKKQQLSKQKQVKSQKVSEKSSSIFETTIPISKANLFGNTVGEKLSSEAKLTQKPTLFGTSSPSNLFKPSEQNKANSATPPPVQGNIIKPTTSTFIFNNLPSNPNPNSFSGIFGQSPPTAFGKIPGPALGDSQSNKKLNTTIFNPDNKTISNKSPIQTEDATSKVVSMFNKVNTNMPINVKQTKDPLISLNTEKKNNNFTNLFNPNQSTNNSLFNKTSVSANSSVSPTEPVIGKQAKQKQSSKNIVAAPKNIDNKSSQKVINDFSNLFKKDNEKKTVITQQGDKKTVQNNRQSGLFGNVLPPKPSQKYDFNTFQTETIREQKPMVNQLSQIDHSKTKPITMPNSLQQGKNNSNSQKIQKNVTQTGNEKTLPIIKQSKNEDLKTSKEKQKDLANKINSASPPQEKKNEHNDKTDLNDIATNLLMKIQDLKKHINKIKLVDSGKNTKTNLQALKVFYEEQVDYLNDPQKLYLGAPLINLLGKSEYARKSYQYYEKVLQAASKNSCNRQEISTQLLNLDQLLTKVIYFQNKFVPKRDIKDKLSKERKYCQHLLNLFSEKLIDLRQQTNYIFNEIKRVQKQKKQNLKQSRKISSQTSKRKFNFAQFTLDSDIKKSQVRQSIQFKENLNRSTKIQSIKKQPGQFRPVYVRLSQVKKNPKYNLKDFQIKLTNPTKTHGKLQQKKMPSSQSFSNINQGKTFNTGRQALKEKVEVPKVDTKILQIKQNQAVSQSYSKSDSESADYPLPSANRQISKIDQPLVKASKKSTTFDQQLPKGTGKNDQGIFGIKLEGKQTGKEIKEPQKQPIKASVPFVLDQNKTIFKNISPQQGTVIKTSVKDEQFSKDEKKVGQTKESLDVKQKQKEKLPKSSNQTSLLSGSLFGQKKQIPQPSIAPSIPKEPMKTSLFGGVKPTQLPNPGNSLFGGAQTVESKSTSKQAVNNNNDKQAQPLKTAPKGIQVDKSIKTDKKQTVPNQLNSLFSFAPSQTNQTSLFGSNQNSSLFTNQKAPESINKESAALKQEGIKKQSISIDPKQGEKPVGLFGSPKAPLKKSDLGQTINKVQNPSVSPSSQPNPLKLNTQKPQIKNAVNNLNDAEAQKQSSGPSLIFQDNKPQNNLLTKPADTTQKKTGNLFANNIFQNKQENPKQQEIKQPSPPQPSTAPLSSNIGSLFQQSGMNKPTFGGVSKLMGQSGQSSGGFDPNAMSFGGAGVGLKSFTSVTTNQNNTLFPIQSQQNNIGSTQQGQNNQTNNNQNHTFGQQSNSPFNENSLSNKTSNSFQSSNFFSNNSNSNFLGGNNSNNSTSLNNNGGLFGNNGMPPSNNMFNQGNMTNSFSQQNNNNIFLQNLATSPPIPPPSSNPSLMAMRK